MTNNQLIVPETSDEAQQLVQQVLDNPHELAPNIQVRFAKRVGRPGASRVMMMDAQTSGPIGEENEDSESKLALRLADGTNVQLSLSFFSDNQPALAGVGGNGGRRTNYAPFNSYVYEPRTYHVKDRESKLPAIMLGMAFILGGVSYGVFHLTGKVAEHDRTFNAAVKTAPTAAVARTSPGKAQAKSPAISTAQKPAREQNIETPASEEELSAKAINHKNSVHISRTAHNSNRSSHSTRSEGFVPPPPPMAFSGSPSMRGFVPPPPPTPYTVPTGIPTAFDPLASLAPAVAHSNRSYSRKLEPVSMSTTIESKPSAFQQQPPIQQIAPTQHAAQQQNATSQPLMPVQQITPSAIEKPTVQQYSDGLPLN